MLYLAECFYAVIKRCSRAVYLRLDKIPSSIVFLPIFPTGWTTNKQTLRIRVGRWLWIPLFVTLGHFVWSVFLSPAHCSCCRDLHTKCSPPALSFLAENETAAGTRSTGSSHGDTAHSLPAFTSLSGAVPFPSWMQKPVLSLWTFPFVPLKEYCRDFSPHRNRHLPAWEP